jgi:hypothetical protein
MTLSLLDIASDRTNLFLYRCGTPFIKNRYQFDQAFKQLLIVFFFHSMLNISSIIIYLHDDISLKVAIKLVNLRNYYIISRHKAIELFLTSQYHICSNGVYVSAHIRSKFAIVHRSSFENRTPVSVFSRLEKRGII